MEGRRAQAGRSGQGSRARHRESDQAETIARLTHAMAAIGDGGDIAAEEKEKSPVRARALRLLSHRARSEKELRERLLEAEYPAGVVEDVIADLTASGLLDDHEFAEEWVRQRRGRRGKSKRALSAELKSKGIGADIRTEVLGQVSDEDEAQLAKQIAHKQAKKITTPPRDRSEYAKYLRRICGALARRGFPAGLSQRIARQALAHRVDELNDGSE